MSQKTARGIRYFDLVTVAIVVLAVGVRVLSPLSRRAWTASDIWGLAAVASVCAGIVVLYRLARAREAPPLAASVVVLLALVLFWTLWPTPLMAFVVMGIAGSMALLIGLVAPFKPIGEPVTRVEAFKLVTIVGSVLTMFVLAELFVRVTAGVFSEETRQLLSTTPSNSGVGHSYIGHLQRPNRTIAFSGKDFTAHHTVDGLGFRNRWPWPEQVDIVAVGDSLTFGLCVDDDKAWPAIVARSTHHGVINLGLVGAGPEQYFRVYETFGSSLRPKLLLVGFYAGNDFWDSGLFDQWLREGVGDNYMVWRDFGRPLRFAFDMRHPMAIAEGLFRSRVYPVVRSSHLYNLARGLQRGDGVGVTKSVTLEDGNALRLMPQDFIEKTAGGNHPDRREFQAVMEALLKIRALARERGAHPLLILQPSKEEVYLPLAGDSVPDPTAALRHALDQAGLDYLDLTPVFRQRAEAGERLFYEIDSHPNEAGYALIGQQVSAHISRNAGAYGLGE